MSQRESLEYLISKLNFREEKPKFIDVDPTSQLATGIKEALVECVALEKDLFQTDVEGLADVNFEVSEKRRVVEQERVPILEDGRSLFQ